ncbi:MBL fold metallo-hydrolase [Brachybacterium phenoliresistens]|uniref:Metal-dependent hydrolase n=1 Tax=Brachybacterium phenoliresistens TaxID=396014 RepID=Z9JR41_9MICO|nr:MBL fold metallo-hydrolase [Brachybacterium phenoliresistens]EWS80855.1 metal-dependent hydrolase [Brachybacterium phenoliresistens]
MRVTVIGCSGSFAGPEGAASSYLIEHEDAAGRTWRVLLDLGSGAFGPLQKVLDPASLDAVVISHLHPDHYLDLTGLEVFWAYNERCDLPQLPLYAPADLPAKLRAIQGRSCDVPDGVQAVPFAHRTLVDGEPFSIGPITFAPRPVIHPVETYGFRITADDEVLVYSGDCDECATLDELAEGCDLFLCEAGYIEGRDDRFTGIHLTGRRAGLTADRAGARRLVLTHIPAWTNPAVPLAEARAVYPGPIELAAPMAILEVAAQRQLQ